MSWDLYMLRKEQEQQKKEQAKKEQAQNEETEETAAEETYTLEFIGDEPPPLPDPNMTAIRNQMSTFERLPRGDQYLWFSVVHQRGISINRPQPNAIQSTG